MMYIISKRIEMGNIILYNVEVAQSDKPEPIEETFKSIRRQYLEFLDQRKVRGLIQSKEWFKVYYYSKKLKVEYAIVYSIEEVSKEFFDLCIDTIGEIGR